MKKTLFQTIEQMLYNRRSLLLFEMIYRAIGVFAIYPIIRIIFFYSISISGYHYITNQVLIKYLVNPSTLILFFVLAFILGVYILIELIFLALLFDLGYHKQKIPFKSFIYLGMKRVYFAIKKYHIFILIPSMVLLFFVQLMNFAGIASTIQIPNFIVNTIEKKQLYIFMSYLFLVLLGIILLESVFSVHLFSIDQHSLKSAYKQSRIILKKNRFKFIVEFIVVNLFLNLVIYLFYALIIALLAGFIWLFVGKDMLLGYILSMLYSVYLVLGIFATIILIPFNFSLISTWYYQFKEKHGSVNPNALLIRLESIKEKRKWNKKGLIIFFIIIAILNITSFISFVDTESNVEILKQTEIIAHRGASLYAPENTLAAFELAIEQGADAIEFDVHLSKDEVPIIIHDDTIKRTTEVTTNIRIKDMTLAEIQSLSAGSWFSAKYSSEIIPTLEELLILVNHRTILFLELKVTSPLLEQKTVDLLSEYDMLDQTVFLSTNRSQLQRIKEFNPDFPTLLLLSSYYGDYQRLGGFDDVDAFGFERSFIQSDPELLEILHEDGKKVYIWTVTDPTQLKEIILLDIDGIITNDPIVAREIAYTEHTQDLYVDLLKKLFKRNNP